MSGELTIAHAVPMTVPFTAAIGANLTGAQQVPWDQVQSSKVWQFVPAEPSPTYKALAAMYGPLVPLKDVAERFLANSLETARRKAALHQLPFPAIQLEQRRKAPWFVRVEQLAWWIDQNALKEHQEWTNSQL